MKILFVHNNFPAQFAHLADALAADPSHQLAAIGTSTARQPNGVNLLRYSLPELDISTTHPFARRFELECRRAEQVLYAASSLLAQGFEPDVVVAHPGWGETIPLRSMFDRAKLVLYCEYYYHDGRDTSFDPEFAEFGLDSKVNIHAKNAATLLSMAQADHCVSPTKWQKDTFPSIVRDEIEVLHEGIDTVWARPNPNARLVLPNGRSLTPADEVVTYVSRNLEPYRGYHVFMRALPKVMAERPRAHVVIVGGDSVSYGAPPDDDRSWKEIFLEEVKERLDPRRIHFLGRIEREHYLSVLQVSTCHVYLTYPFILSWSALEAMSVGCVLIGSDTGPVQEVISDGENGMLVSFFDSDALADKIIEVLAHRQRFAKLRASARKTVQARFDLKTHSLPKWMEYL